MTKGIKKTREEFINESNDVHGEETYNYDHFVFKNYSTRGKIIYQKEGHPPFKKTPTEQIAKEIVCPKCSYEQRHKNSFKAKYKDLGIK